MDSIEALIARLSAEAHAERKKMVEAARRSIGQRFRYARERLRKVTQNECTDGNSESSADRLPLR